MLCEKPIDLDAAVTLLRAATGAVATIINSRHRTVGYEQRLEVFGSTGALDVGNQGTSLMRGRRSYSPTPRSAPPKSAASSRST